MDDRSKREPRERVRFDFDPDERERQKQASRDEDDRAIAAGEKSPAQVERENAVFAVFARGYIDFDNPNLY